VSPLSALDRISRARIACVVAALCAGIFSAVAGAPTERQAGLTLKQEGADLVVQGRLYRAVIAPQNGGRVTSFVSGGTEMTRLSSDGHGGLIEEVHTADFPFEVIEREATDRYVSITLTAAAGDLRIVKAYRFRADRPFISVQLTFENMSGFWLRGASAPALRALATPAGTKGPQRTLYCLDRGAGGEVLSEAGAVALVTDSPAADLRWIAAADPVARQALGFVLTHGTGHGSGCRPLPPLRTQPDGLVLGWRYPPIPPRHSLATTVQIIPLNGFAAVAELNEQFAAESLPQPSPEGFAVQLGLTAIRDPLADVSAVTRTYAETGEELEPCDALVFRSLEPFVHQSARAEWPRKRAGPAWLVHEVYRSGRRIGHFAVPVSQTPGKPPLPAAPPPLPQYEPVAAQALPPESPAGPPAEPKGRSFVLRRLIDGSHASEVERIELALLRQESKALFFQVKALRPMGKLRLTVAAMADAEGSPASLVPAAAYLWQVEEDQSGRAHMLPCSELSLGAGDAAAIALTVSARQLTPGVYSAHLVVSGDGAVAEIPLSVRVLEAAIPARETFGLWWVAAPAAAGSLAEPASDAGVRAFVSEAAMARLAGYGVSALTVPAPSDSERALSQSTVRSAAGAGFMLLSFGAPCVSLPPAEVQRGRLILPMPDPIWLLRAGSATPGTVLATMEAGYVPALLSERLSAVPPALTSPEGPPVAWLVEDGCEPGLVPELVRSGAVRKSDTVWLYLDLRETDWRRAMSQVRSAFWAAAWQGLAGAAVCCEPPPPEVDRQAVIWHILRDARQDVALWRQARGEVRARAARAQEPAERGRLLAHLATLEGIVGVGPTCDLVLRPERWPFRQLYKAVPSAATVRGGPANAAQVEPLEATREKVLSIIIEPGGALPAPAADQLFWSGIALADPPLADGSAGPVRWAVVAADGKGPWKEAVALQQALEEASGRSVPLSRTFPPLWLDPPRLVWLIAEGQPQPDWPESVREAILRAPSAELLTVSPKKDVTVGVLGPGFDLSMLLSTFRRSSEVYLTAQHVR